MLGIIIHKTEKMQWKLLLNGTSRPEKYEDFLCVIIPDKNTLLMVFKTNSMCICLKVKLSCGTSNKLYHNSGLVNF